MLYSAAGFECYAAVLFIRLRKPEVCCEWRNQNGCVMKRFSHWKTLRSDEQKSTLLLHFWGCLNTVCVLSAKRIVNILNASNWYLIYAEVQEIIVLSPKRPSTLIIFDYYTLFSFITPAIVLLCHPSLPPSSPFMWPLNVPAPHFCHWYPSISFPSPSLYYPRFPAALLCPSPCTEERRKWQLILKVSCDYELDIFWAQALR